MGTFASKRLKMSENKTNVSNNSKYNEVPVVWGEPQKVIEPICNSENCPDIIISFGEASKVFEIETVARKHRSAEATDEHFNTPTKIEIYDDGEDLYEACFDAHSVMSRILE